MQELRFFQTLKMEEVCLKDYRSFEKAEENIAEFLGEVYRDTRVCTPASDICLR